MNQNTNNNQETQQIEVVDLAKTQVLNLGEVEETVVYENKTSKKPAIMLAIAGIFSILVGVIYPTVMNSLNADDVSTEVISTSSSCFLEDNGETTGVTTIGNITLNFGNLKLLNYTSNISVSTSATASDPITATNTITNLFTNYQTLSLNKVDGYVLTATSSGTSGFTATLDVDLEKFNSSSIDSAYKQDKFLNVLFKYNDDSEKVKASLKKIGYSCD